VLGLHEFVRTVFVEDQPHDLRRQLVYLLRYWQHLRQAKNLLPLRRVTSMA
jgi:hypothetical protein